MKIIRATVVPIECFEREMRERIEKSMLSDGSLVGGYKGSLARTFNELVDDAPALYHTKNSKQNVCVAFHGSSICFVKFTTLPEDTVTAGNVKSELLARRALHNAIQRSSGEVFGIPLPDVENDEGYKIAPSYAFSFYLIDSAKRLSPSHSRWLKVLAEPSVVDLDDMSSSENSETAIKLSKEAIAHLRKIRDCDLSGGSVVHVTWASVVAIDKTDSKSFSRTLDIVTVLEIKLQMIWNRCYAMSNYADAIFARRTTHSRFNDFYWGIVRAFDDAKGVLSSTSSTRVNEIFKEMLSTSNLSGEISRLESKISLCEKFIAEGNQKKDARYRKAIELLLFVTALSQLAPVMFQLPVDWFKEREIISAIILGFMFLIGLGVISIRR